jgi:hypothetical protein
MRQIKLTFGFGIAMTAIILSMIIILFIAYSHLYDFKPAEFMNAPFPVQDTTLKEGELAQVKQGDRITYFVKYHKLMSVPCRATHMLVNHVQINFSDIVSYLPVGDYEMWNHDITIPEFVAPGEYYITITWTYRINPIREVIITERTQSFMVIAK